jgi:hypothetical protein
MADSRQRALRNKTVEEIDLSKYQEGTGESEDLHKKHHAKVKSQFSQHPKGEEPADIADPDDKKRQVSFRDLNVKVVDNVTSSDDLELHVT